MATREEIRSLPSELRPLSPWTFWGLRILYSIPVVGCVFLIIHCFLGNVNRKAFARSHFINFILIGLLFLIMLLAGGSTGLIANIWNTIKNYFGGKGGGTSSSTQAALAFFRSIL